jgi:hypothetical protein
MLQVAFIAVQSGGVYVWVNTSKTKFSAQNGGYNFKIFRYEL